MNQVARKIKLGRAVSLEVAPVVKRKNKKKKNLLTNIGDIIDMGSIPGLGRSPRVLLLLLLLLSHVSRVP